MVDHDEQGTQDLLERATESLRDAPIPDSLLPPIMVSTVKALQALVVPPDAVRLSTRRRAMFRIARYSGVTVAVMLLAVAGASFFLIDRSAGTLFAQVVQNVKKARSVSYSYRGKVDPKPLVSYRQYESGNLVRLEYENGASHVVDLDRKKGLILVPERKLAFAYSTDEKTAAECRDRMTQLFNLLESKDAQRSGTETLKGREVVVYQVKVQETAAGLWAYPGAINTVFVDAKMKLPVRVEIRWPNGDFFLYDDFAWNEPLPPSLFQFHVPEGYSVKTAEERLEELRRAGDTTAPPVSPNHGGNPAND